MAILKDLTGKRFGRLYVIKRSNDAFTSGGHRNVTWLCRCDCGKEVEVRGSRLNKGETKSCGCLFKEIIENGSARRTHGMRNTREYSIWCNMRQRCTNPNSSSFPRYGGRGVSVCDRWLESFQNFYDDLGPAPSPDHSLERLDNNSGYSAENCRWATTEDQVRNKRNNVVISSNGETLVAADWCKKLGGNRGLVWKRLKRGWSEEAAVTTPVDTSKRNR